MSNENNNGYASSYGKIWYIDDPNSINVNTGMTNSIAQYQDMHIDANLNAVVRGRSVIETKVVNGVRYGSGFNEDEVNIGFLGATQYDKNSPFENNPNIDRFTTNYYDGSVSESETQFESFGITKIDIKINSSYVPVINIEFTDVRGLSFFSQKKSPYRILFNFPPPIFTLRVKGYYGRAVEYVLHLLKYTTEFKSENGNFVISAEFVPLTFAPLTDILFRYVVNAPLFDKKLYEGVNTGGAPTTTFALIKRLKHLSEDLTEKVEGSIVQEKFEKSKKKYIALKDILTGLEDYRNNPAFNVSKPQLFMATPLIGPVTGGYPRYYELSSLSEYKKELFDSKGNLYQDSSQVKEKLYLGYEVVSNTTTNTNSFINALSGHIPSLNNFYINYKKTIESQNIRVNSVAATDVTLLKPSILAYPSADIPTTFEAIDITELYFTLIREINDTNVEITKLNDALEKLKEDITEKNLGMAPTIYNIFKIILDDVDLFFNVVRKASVEAEGTHHPKYKNKIINGNVGGYADNMDKVYAFPLVYETLKGKCNKVKVSPKEISDALPEKFPEMELVDKIMLSFVKQAQFDVLDEVLKQKDASTGVNSWIPINPLDSELNDDGDGQSPYRFIDYMNSDSVTSMFVTLLDRFYVLSQYGLPYRLYDDESGEAYTEYFAKAEAANIALTIVTENGLNQLKTKLDSFIGNISNFYTFLNNMTTYKDYSNITDSSYMQFGYRPQNSGNSNNGVGVFIDKTTNKFIGSYVTTKDIGVQDLKNVPENSPLGKFRDDTVERTHRFSQQNISYVPTIGTSGLTTPFVFRNVTLNEIADNNTNYYKIYFDNGNQELSGSVSSYNETASIPERWGGVAYMEGNRTLVNTYLTGTSLTVAEKMLILTSNFGCTFSPYNKYYSDLNGIIFNVPCIVETPEFLGVYIGALLTVYNNGGKTRIDDILNNYLNYYSDEINLNLHGAPVHYSNVIRRFGEFIACDMHDITNYMCDADKAMYIARYNEFMTNNVSFISDVVDFMSVTPPTNMTNSNDIFRYYMMTLASGDYYDKITKPLMRGVNLVVTSELSYYLPKLGTSYTPPTNFIPLKTINVDANKKKRNDFFFKTLFTELKSMLDLKKNKLKEMKETYDNIIYDEDIINQTYYSIKNINDKWISTPLNDKSITKYPYNDGTGSLIDLFAFVDRAMNPIGDTIIYAETLIDSFSDPNATIFSVISQLLSVSNFEFFPLQNFLTHTQESWEEAFIIDPHGNVSKRAFFVCMYIGGSASQLSGVDDNEYVDDGIADITKIDSNEFNGNCDGESMEILGQTMGSNVFAFNVKFAEQNQSMFKDIKIQSKDYPETNESIQIMSRIAGDGNDSAPAQKAQNLYNVYEGRAYSATITGLGNMMIQPTQYFQLSNVPLYHGAYMILDVEHHITPNHMTTSFTGTKVAKFPAPRVTKSTVNTKIKRDDTTTDVSRGTATTTISNATINSKYFELPQTVPPPSTEVLSYVDAKALALQITNNNDDMSKAIFSLMYAESRHKGEAFSSAGGHNYTGVQTDNSSRWGNGDNLFVARFVRKDSKRFREFAQFANDDDFIKFMSIVLKRKGFTATSSQTLADVYLNNWVYKNLKDRDPAKYYDLLSKKTAIFDTAFTKYDNA